MREGAGIRRIVVGVDGSQQSLAALGWAARMAQGMGSEVVAVYAVPRVMYWAPGFSPPAQYDPEWREAVRAELEGQWCRPLKEAGVRYRALMEDGRPASVIAEVADRVDADVIVVGRRGRGGVAELLLGSVSHELTLHATRPVLLISPTHDRAGAERPAAVRTG
jgi:nucleotide-binding universal stress UspA family protein